jgi:hypothetical protein
MDIQGGIDQLDLYLDDHDCNYSPDATCPCEEAIDRRATLVIALNELEDDENDITMIKELAHGL